MKKPNFLGKALPLLTALATLFSCAGPAPSNLRTEHQEGPVVVDPGTAPRLSWPGEAKQSTRKCLV